MMAFLEIGKQDSKQVDQEKKHDKLVGTLITDEVMKPSPARPLRKRKGVDRFPIEAVPRRSASRKIVVYQGYGTPLKDIPNVSFKLSKRKTDNNLVLLHVILFGKKAKAPMVKKNLGLFSGFLWVEEEEKQRSKVRKKLDQCVKAKLLDFCNILDIPVNKATVKKEDLSAMLLKFLESPHPTTETLLADKKKTRKIKQNSRGGVKHQQSNEEEDKKSESSIGEVHPREDSDNEEANELEGDSEDEQAPRIRKRTAVRKINSKECRNSKTGVGHSTKSSKKRSSGSSSKEGSSEAETDSKDSVVKKRKVEKKTNKISESETESKSSSVKKVNVRNEKNKGQNASVAKTSSKKNASSKPPAKAKTTNKGKTCNKEEIAVTGEEMQTALAGILKKVDLNTATLADILGQLRAHFNIDLSHRKAEVKALITEIISNMMDEDEEPDTGNVADNEDDNDTYYD